MSKNNSKFTPSEAIRAINGMTRKRFYEMLGSGEITYTTEKWGKKDRRIIDASELIRVFGSDFQIKETTETEKSDNKKQVDTTETTLENKLLEQKVEFLSEQLEDQKTQLVKSEAMVSNLSSKLDKAQTTIERQTYLIQDMRDKSPEKPVQGNENFSRTGEPKNEKGYSGAKFSAIAATILLAFLLGGVGVYFWPEIEARLMGSGSSELLAEGSKSEDLNLIAPAAGEKKEGQGVILPDYRMNFTPAPDLLND